MPVYKESLDTVLGPLLVTHHRADNVSHVFVPTLLLDLSNLGMLSQRLASRTTFFIYPILTHVLRIFQFTSSPLGIHTRIFIPLAPMNPSLSAGDTGLVKHICFLADTLEPKC